MSTARTLSAATLKGDPMRTVTGEELGKLDEIVLDLRTGRIAYAVMATGGILGFGKTLYAIPWELILVDTDNRELIVAVEKGIIEKSPGFDNDDWPDMTDLTWNERVYGYFRVDPYWKN